MKSLKTYFSILLVAIFCLATVSCNDFLSKRDIKYHGLTFGWKFQSNTVSGNDTLNLTAEVIGPQQSNDVTLDVTAVDSLTTAQAGVHYQLPQSSVTIPANTSTAPFPVIVKGSNVQGTPVELTLKLHGTQKIKADSNLSLYHLIIQKK